MRSASSPSVSFAVSAIAAPGSCRPKCVCMFIRPGDSHFPGSLISVAPAGTATWPAGPTAVMRSSVMTTTAFMIGAPPSRFATFAPVITRTTGAGTGAVTGAGGGGGGAVCAAATPASMAAATHSVVVGARGGGGTPSGAEQARHSLFSDGIAGDRCAPGRARLEYRASEPWSTRPGCR